MSDVDSRTPSDTRVAIRNTIFAQMCGAVLPQMLVQGGLASLLVMAAGGNDFHVGLVFTIGSLALLGRLVVAPIIDTMSPRVFLIRGLALAGITACGIFLAWPVQHWVGSTAALWYVIAILSLYQLVDYLGSAAWFPLLNFIVPPRLRGRYFGQMRRAWQATLFIIMIAAGAMLGESSTLLQFYPVLLIAVLFYFLRIYFLWLLPDPPPARTGQKESMVTSLGRPIRDARYRIFLVFLTINAFIVALVVPFAAPFMKKDLGIPDGYVVYATSAMLIGAMLTLPYWGRVADAIGNRFVLFVGLAMQTIAIAMLASAPTYADHTVACMSMCVGSFFLIGIGQSCYGIGQTVRQFHLSPHKYHGAYSNIVNATMGVSMACAAFAGGLIYNALPTTLPLAGYDTLSKRPFFFMAAGLLLMMIAMLRLLVPIREPHATRIARMIVYNLPAPIAGPVMALARVTRGEKK